MRVDRTRKDQRFEAPARTRLGVSETCQSSACQGNLLSFKIRCFYFLICTEHSFFFGFERHPDFFQNDPNFKNHGENRVPRGILLFGSCLWGKLIRKVSMVRTCEKDRDALDDMQSKLGLIE